MKKFLICSLIIFSIIIMSFFSCKIVLNKDVFLLNKNTKNAKSCVKSDCFYQNNRINNSGQIIFTYKDKVFNISLSNSGTKVQEKFFKQGYNSRINVMKFAFINGFTEEEAICYAFPEIKKFVESFEQKLYIPENNAQLTTIKNTGSIYVKNDRNGLKMDKNTFFRSVFNIFCDFSKSVTYEIPTVSIAPKVTIKDLELCKNLRGSFKTYYSNSNLSRKNNIKKALDALDGVTLNPGERLSFNKITGERTEESGYQKAKVIKNGTFFEEFGGGVCQVSSTLYNAALIAGLEIVEVWPHSLPVSYVEPCFDAMVNTGYNDLVIKNNTEKPIVIATSSSNDVCLVNIYGVKNEYDIKRKSEIVEEIKEFETEVTSDYKRFGLESPINEGEVKTVIYGKPGKRAIGLLEFYKDDVLIRTKKIRENLYKPTKEILLVS